MSEFYKIGEFADKIGVTPQTLRTWDKEGKLKPAKVTEGGTRYYSEYQYQIYKGNKFYNKHPRVIIGYARVSTPAQKDDLARQVDNLKSYMIAKGYQFEIITDIGSGINYNKKGLQQLIRRIATGDVEKLVILYKDRLVRFGFELIEYLCSLNETNIEIIDNTNKSEEQELVEDLIQIITVFSARLHGKRRKNTERLMSELKLKE